MFIRAIVLPDDLEYIRRKRYDNYKKAIKSLFKVTFRQVREENNIVMDVDLIDSDEINPLAYSGIFKNICKKIS